MNMVDFLLPHLKKIPELERVIEENNIKNKNISKVLLLAGLVFFIYYSLSSLFYDQKNMDIYLNYFKDIKSNSSNFLFIQAPGYASLLKDKLQSSGSEVYTFVINCTKNTYQEYENSLFDILGEDTLDYINDYLDIAPNNS